MMSDDYKPEPLQEQDSHPPPPEDRRGSYHSDRNSKSPQRQSQSDQDNYEQGGGGGPVRGGDSSYRRGGGYGGKPYGRPYDRPPRSYGGPPPQGGGPSSKDCRVYVGNLPYTLRWFELKDFCREAGEVVRAEILMLPNGRSKGCGIVEFRSPDDAKNAIKIFQDREMNGRPIFVREDREDFLKPSRPVLGFGRSYGFRPPPRGSFGPPPGPPNPCMVFVQNIPYSAHWQNLKDLFRDAGEVVKADVLVFPDSGRSRGVGTVIFETEAAAQNAISMFNGYEWNGRKLEVREDRGRPYRGGFGGPGGPPSRYSGPPSSRPPSHSQSQGPPPSSQGHGYGSGGGSGYQGQSGYEGGSGYDGYYGYEQGGYDGGYDQYYGQGGGYDQYYGGQGGYGGGGGGYDDRMYGKGY